MIKLVSIQGIELAQIDGYELDEDDFVDATTFASKKTMFMQGKAGDAEIILHGFKLPMQGNGLNQEFMNAQNRIMEQNRQISWLNRTVLALVNMMGGAANISVDEMALIMDKFLHVEQEGDGSDVMLTIGEEEQRAKS